MMFHKLISDVGSGVSTWKETDAQRMMANPCIYLLDLDPTIITRRNMKDTYNMLSPQTLTWKREERIVRKYTVNKAQDMKELMQS